MKVYLDRALKIDKHTHTLTVPLNGFPLGSESGDKKRSETQAFM